MILARFLDLALLEPARRRSRETAGILLGAALGLLPGLAAAETRCDYSGFEKPCSAGGGEYRVLVPDGKGPFPAMVYLYGSGGRSVDITSHPLFEAAVAGRGYALIVPAANELTYAGGLRDTGWKLRHEPRGGGEETRDEVAFIRAVIEDAARRFPIDRGRVLIAGQSRGGFLAWEIACHEPDLAAAYAVHGASYLGPLPAACEAPVRFLHTQGRADPLVPVAGRRLGGGDIVIAPMHEALDLLARAGGCDGEPGEASAHLEFERQGWAGCAPGSRLDLMLHEGGHGMPASWFRAVLDWFEEPLPEPAETAPVVRRIGEGLPVAGVGAEADRETRRNAPTGGRFKAPPEPGARALGAPPLATE